MGALGYMKTLETDRLILRDWTLDDIGCDVYDEGTIRFLISARNNYAVVLKESGEVIGTIGINEDAANRSQCKKRRCQYSRAIPKQRSDVRGTDMRHSEYR